MKVILIVIGTIVLLAVASIVFGSFGLSDIKKMTISDVDFQQIPDGVYKGKFHKVRWNYDVEVVVKNHKIETIRNVGKLSDENQKKLINKAIELMIEKQSINIDAVSGATVTTKAFRKAVENALFSAEKP